ncbi:MAG: glycoside hydrolase family 78 protein [Planctomycetota bacterium]
MSRFAMLMVACVVVGSQCSAQETIPARAGLGAPANLRCEYLVDPLGIDETAPRLSWEMVDSRRGAVQTAYYILVADDRQKLDAGVGNLWDTGQVAGDESIQIVYAGKPLRARMQLWWKVRVWDKNGNPSPWSAPGRWSMGLLEPGDWQANWIGDPTAPPPVSSPNNGYHSELADNPETQKWIDIDLGQSSAIDAVRLFPARPYNWIRDEPGFLFPVRFKILVASRADFNDAVTVVDRTPEDVPGPGAEPQTYEFSPVEGRYIRLLATRLRERDSGQFGLALAEMQVLSKDVNVAGGKEVSASDSIERPEWSIRFLVDDDLVSHGLMGMEPLVPPMLRKSFVFDERAKMARAVVYVTALGLYELHINGQRVGDRRLAPEWTDYHQRVQYQTYDVSELLRAGENVIGVQLADGWYAGRIGLAQIVPGGPPRAIYGRQPRLLLQLEIERADGELERIVSDESWRLTTDGPLRVADLLDGEVYDARQDRPGWDKAGFDDATWQAVGVFAATDAQLVAQPNEPIRVTREIIPVGVTEPRPNVYIFDMGQNFAGWCRLRLHGSPGQTVTLRHAEVLNPDGTIYTDNLRSATATDRYTLRGDGVEVYEPRFTYHGFRYVEVAGLTEAPPLETLTGCVVHTDAREVGEFKCSDPLLNKLWRNIIWTQRANLHSVPTDCPQRDERLGWTGDILAFAQTGCFNMDMAAFFTKWIPDLRDAQTADGRYPDFAPHPFDPGARFSGVPAWGDAGVFVPWCQYQNYGDRRMLERHFESARRWVDWIHENNPDLLWQNKRHNDYGDWLNADTLKLEGWPTQGAAMPKDAFATAFFARSTQLVARMAQALGRESDALRYATLAAEIRQAFNHAYVDADGRIVGDTQAGYALALHFDLLPEESRAVAAQRMVDCFAKYDGQISTGFHSTICLMNELTRHGCVDEAYRLIGNRKMPSWGYAIEHGATTIWERWDGYVEGRGFQNPGMNSFAHYALGSVGEWMYRTIVGINPDPEIPAYKHFIIRPRPGGDLTWARGSYHSIHGRIACEWRVEGERLRLDVTVPPNTRATAYLPTTNVRTAEESGQALADAEGVQDVRPAKDHIVCELAAGSYSFELDWKN